MTIDFKGETYEMSTSLRVMYKLQSKLGNKPYMEIFQDIKSMRLEEQIKMLFIAFDNANPKACTEMEFLNEALDNWGLSHVTNAVGELIQQITYNGLSPKEIVEVKNRTAALVAESQV